MLLDSKPKRILMFTPIRSKTLRSFLLFAAVSPALILSACSSSTTSPTAPSQYAVVKLTSDVPGGAANVDANLKNPWGCTFDPTGNLLIVGLNHSGTVAYYDTTGHPPGGLIQVPSATATTGGSPSGVIASANFTIKTLGPTEYIFATEDGTLSAWNQSLGSSPATRVASQTGVAVYKGLTEMSGKLYVANIKTKKVDIYNSDFTQGISFPDSHAPSGYGPFNLAVIDSKLYATWTRAKMPDATGGVDDSAGAGIGYVGVYDANGNWQSQFATGGTLNSPWGIVKAPSGFGQYANQILVGNFGDGTINAFDNSGKYLGQVSDATGKVIVIDGLWALVAGPNGPNNRIYYTAGTNKENDGTLGYIQFVK